jgi:hypothetical protein
MDQILTLGLLIVLGLLSAMYARHQDHIGYFALFVIVLMAIVLASVYIGGQGKSTAETKKKLTPTIKVECLGNKCDTTYIYKF